MRSTKIVIAAFVSALFMQVVADTVQWLDDQDLNEFCMVGQFDKDIKKPKARKNVLDTPIKIGGYTYERGVGLHAFPKKTWTGDFFPAGKCRRFEAKFGLDDRSGDGASAILNLYVDDRLVATSGVVRKGEPAKEMSVDLKGALVLYIEVREGGTLEQSAYANLADAAFVMEDGANLLRSPESFSRQLDILTPPDDGKPRVNGPALYGVRPRKHLLYRVPVSGERPMKIVVEGLPEGTYFDEARQQLRGVTPSKKGDYPLVIRAKNAKGETTRNFLLRVGDKIGLTPPMGWNSWNSCSMWVSDEKIRTVADATIGSGLAEHGWQYVVIDDGWTCANSIAEVQGGPREKCVGKLRDENGNILPNQKFPDMKALSDYVHDKGLKFGIYSSPGPKTCAGLESSWKNEWRDARQFIEWGVDYLKHDACSYGSGDSREFSEGRWSKLLPYMMMGKAIQEGDRDIFFSISSIVDLYVDTFQRCRANSQRITSDVFNSWPLVRRSMIAERYYWTNTEPGQWCDPDMLVLQSYDAKRGHCMTPNEAYTHFSLWCLYSAPLMMGFPLEKATPLTLSMLTNDEVLEVNQDSLGLCAALIQTPGRDEVWAKPMSDGSIAAGLVNMGYVERKVKFCFKMAGMRGKWRVRDLWRQKEEGVFENCYEVSIPGHATQLVRIWPTEGAKFDDDVLDIRDFAWMRLVEEERPLKPDAEGCRPCDERRKAARSTFEADSAAMSAAMSEAMKEK